MERERPPVGRAELDRWASAAADPTDAAVAGILAGVDPGALARWESAAPDGSEFVAWQWVEPTWLIGHVIEWRRAAYAKVLSTL